VKLRCAFYLEQLCDIGDGRSEMVCVETGKSGGAGERERTAPGYTI